MIPEVLVRIFWYLKNHEVVELVSSFWRDCSRKSRHLKILWRLDKISTQIKPKSQLILIVRKLNNKYLRTNFSQLNKLYQLTKSQQSNWLQLDRACQFLKKFTINNHLFEFFEVIGNQELYHEYDNLLKTKVIKALKKRKLQWNLLFVQDLSKTGKLYFAINLENNRKLKKIAQILNETNIMEHFRYTTNEFRTHLYDRLLTFNLKEIKKSCQEIGRFIRDRDDFNDFVLVYVLGRKVNKHYEDSYPIKYLWPRPSDFTWFPLDIMFCTFDTQLIINRLTILKNQGLIKRCFDFEFKSIIIFFVHLIQLTDEQFTLFLSCCDLNWVFLFLLPSEILVTPVSKLKKRLCILKERFKNNEPISFNYLQMNTNELNGLLNKN